MFVHPYRPHQHLTKFRLPPDLVDLLYAEAATRDGEGAQGKAGDYDGDIA